MIRPACNSIPIFPIDFFNKILCLLNYHQIIHAKGCVYCVVCKKIISVYATEKTAYTSNEIQKMLLEMSSQEYKEIEPFINAQIKKGIVK